MKNCYKVNKTIDFNVAGLEKGFFIYELRIFRTWKTLFAPVWGKNCLHCSDRWLGIDKNTVEKQLHVRLNNISDKDIRISGEAGSFLNPKF